MNRDATSASKTEKAETNSPAEMLAGLKLDAGWTVLEKVENRIKNQTGGFFSVRYLVENERGKKGFLKALDITKFGEMKDAAKQLELVTRSFNHERELLGICGEKRLTRVVTPINSGDTPVPNSAWPHRVQYLIFELATGDLRSQMGEVEQLDLAHQLSMLHQIAAGIDQLHRAKIAHQDIKPSNVLVFEGSHNKIADLGRAVREGSSAPHENLSIPGDLSYAPPELLFRHVSADHVVRRYGCDAYLFGSMICFVFCGTPFTTLLLNKLSDEHHPDNWADGYEKALPFVRDAFGFAVDLFATQVPEPMREKVVQALKELCDPDPELRGHPLTRARVGNSFSLERYISLFALLSKQALVGTKTWRNR